MCMESSLSAFRIFEHISTLLKIERLQDSAFLWLDFYNWFRDHKTSQPTMWWYKQISCLKCFIFIVIGVLSKSSNCLPSFCSFSQYMLMKICLPVENRWRKILTDCTQFYFRYFALCEQRCCNNKHFRCTLCCEFFILCR